VGISSSTSREMFSQRGRNKKGDRAKKKKKKNSVAGKLSQKDGNQGVFLGKKTGTSRGERSAMRMRGQEEGGNTHHGAGHHITVNCEMKTKKEGAHNRGVTGGGGG